jgi:hypothetical protein
MRTGDTASRLAPATWITILDLVDVERRQLVDEIRDRQPAVCEQVDQLCEVVPVRADRRDASFWAATKSRQRSGQPRRGWLLRLRCLSRC